MIDGTPLLVLNGHPPRALLAALANAGEAWWSTLPACAGEAGAAWRRPGPVWAADGGANTLWAEGLAAAAVVGDLDSIAPAALDWHRARGARILARRDQDHNDLEKALAELAAAGAARCWVAGFEGERLDMFLGLSALLGPGRPPRLALAGEAQVVLPLAAGRQVLELGVDARFSLLALAEVCRLDLEGARWQGRDIRLEPGCGGVSNRARGAVTVTVHRGSPLVAIRAPWAESPGD